MQTFFRILITTLTVTECQLISHRQEMTAPHMRRICVYFYDAHSLLHRVAVSRVSGVGVYGQFGKKVCKLAIARFLCVSIKVYCFPVSQVHPSLPEIKH